MVFSERREWYDFLERGETMECRPWCYRSMLPDETGTRPRLGNDAKSLGVRVRAEGAVHEDVPVFDGSVHPGTGGLSVNRSPATPPSFLIPEKYANLYPYATGGYASMTARCYGVADLIDGPLADQLSLRVDSSNHGVVEPDSEMTLIDYGRVLERTQSDWRRIPWVDGGSE